MSWQRVRCRWAPPHHPHRLTPLTPGWNQRAISQCSDCADTEVKSKSLILCEWLAQPLAMETDTLWPLKFPQSIHNSRALGKPVPGTLPVGSVDSLGGPRPLSLLPSSSHSTGRSFPSSSTGTSRGLLTQAHRVPEGAQCHAAPHRHTSSGFGMGEEGELLCYMERLSPLSENKVLPLGTNTQAA